MAPQAEAIIYLADSRGCTQSHWYRSYHTLKQGKSAFGHLQLLNDDTLKGGRTYQYTFKEDMLMLLLPVVGQLVYQCERQVGRIDAGECKLLFIPRGSVLMISNPYADELINYVCAGWYTCGEVGTRDLSGAFDLEEQKNKLLALPGRQCFIGKFEGREEGAYVLPRPDKGVFVLVLEGAFEVQNRLLEPRDGLALWNVNEIEFEALSENAVLLLLEAEVSIGQNVLTA